PVIVPWISLPPIPDVVPTAAWGDAAVIVPWVLHERTGGLALLREQYPSMTAWVDQLAGLAGDTCLWDTGPRLGDWLDPTAPPERPFEAQTDPALVASAYLAHSARLVAETAALLGHTTDAARYRTLADRVRAAFDSACITSEGKVAGDSQTAYALALRFGLLDGEERRRPRRRAPGRAGPRQRPPQRNRLRRHPPHLRRPHRRRRRRGRLPAAAPDRVPVLAVRGHHGRHHHLGTLGQHAARRNPQPRRDDLLQPLRPRRRRRLDAPHHRRPRPGRTRLPPPAHP